MALFVADSSLLSSVNKSELCQLKMKGQIFSHKKENNRERDWLKLERSGEFALSLLGRWEGNPHGMVFPGSSFPFMPGHRFCPMYSPTPSPAFCLSWLFSCIQDLHLGTGVCSPSGPCESSTPYTTQGENKPP